MFVLVNACPKCHGNLYVRGDETGAYLACVYIFCLWVGDAEEFGKDWQAVGLDEEPHEE